MASPLLRPRRRIAARRRGGGGGVSGGVTGGGVTGGGSFKVKISCLFCGLAWLVSTLTVGADAQAALFPDVPLHTHTDVSALFHEPHRACYSEGSRVARGTPRGCGEGCQYADKVVAYSSEFVFDGKPSSTSLEGPPDVYPTMGTKKGAGAWMPLRQDAGTEFITFEVPQPVYATGMLIYETHHPGAVYIIEGQAEKSDVEGAPEPPFVTLWTGTAAPPPGSSVYNAQTGEYSTMAREWYPSGFIAPRTTRLKTFRISLNTALVPGYNAIDAVKVFGDTESGHPVRELTPVCTSAADKDCYHTCTQSDVVKGDSAAANLRLLSEATRWISRALKVRGSGSAPFKLPAIADEDVSAPFCGGLEGIPVPPRYQTTGIAASTRLVVFVTSRPDPRQALRAAACRYDASARSKGRPLAVHLNMVPSFGLAAHAANSEAVKQAAVDAVTHFLYLAIGFSGKLRSNFMISPGKDVRTEQLVKCSKNDMACTAAWEERYLVTQATPNLLAKAQEHFNLPTMLFVELENGVSNMEESHINRVFDEWNGEGGKGILLEHRLFAGEIMTLPAYAALATTNASSGSDWKFPTSTSIVTPLAKSAISMGLLQDTGWYFPDYSKADVLPWGRKLGAEFVLNKCNLWPETARAYVCPRTANALSGRVFDSGDAATKLRCNADRTHKGKCLVADHPAGFTRTLPPAFQYFTRPAEAHLGGYSELHDFCPITFPYSLYPASAEDSASLPWSDGIADAVEDCRSTGVASRTALGYLETKEVTSRCFDVTRARVEHPACLKHHCSATGDLSIFVAGSWRVCPQLGGSLEVQSEALVINCPSSYELCERWTEMQPDIVVLSPTPNSIAPIDTVVSFELANFAIGASGTMRISAGGMGDDADIIAEVTVDPSPASIIKAVNVQLPFAEAPIVLRFELVSAETHATVAAKEVSLTVTNSIQMFVSSISNVSSEYVEIPDVSPARLVGALVGPPDSTGYGSSAAAWTILSLSAQGTSETVDLSFERSCYPKQIDVWQSFGAGKALSAVSAIADNAAEGVVQLWEGRAESPPLVVPKLGATVTPYSELLRSTGTRTRKLRVSFRAPPWAEIDAVRMLGDREMPPKLEVLGGGLHIAVQVGGVAHDSLKVTNQGTSLLVWELRQVSGFSTGLHPSATHGVLRGSSSLTLNITANATEMQMAGNFPHTMAMFGVFNRFAKSGSLPVATFRVTAMAMPGHGSAAAEVSCYHGVAVQERADQPAVCRCLPGAYGTACEFLHCPNNCTGTIRAGGFAGMCDKFTGTCVCATGYDGRDCSGKQGDCYLSFDGTCRAGFDAGTFVLNTEDEGNLNRGDGILPQGLACGSGVSDGNELGCAAFPKIQTCCRPSTEPACPFASSNSAPCSACGVGVWRGETPSGSCLAAISEFCLMHPGEAACHPFLPLPLPTGFCPYELALQHCTMAGGKSLSTDPLCQSVAAPDGVCAFEAKGGSDPCASPACQVEGALFATSGACRLLVDEHCFSKHPSDRACDAVQLGDGCPFESGSAPCLEATCAPHYDANLSGATCTKTIERYCTSVPSGGVVTDVECLARGYGGPLRGAVLPYNGMTCPWAAALARCAASPLEPQCVRLRSVGYLASGRAASVPIPDAKALADAVVTTNSSTAAAYVAAYRDTMSARLVRLARLNAVHAAFAYGDVDGDGHLGPMELETAAYFAVADAQAAGAPLRALSGMSGDALMGLANPRYPDIVRRAEFVANVEALLDSEPSR